MTQDFNDKQREEWNKYCSQLGLKPEHFRKRVKMKDGNGATIIGIRFRTKFAVQVLASNGEYYGMTVNSVKTQL